MQDDSIPVLLIGEYSYSSQVCILLSHLIIFSHIFYIYTYTTQFLSGFVYPVVAHSFWSVNGFLSAFAADPLWGVGVIDLAGCGAVHMTGGVAALVMGIILGPRKGRFHDEEGNALDEPASLGPHSVTLQFLGTFGLWFGWYVQ